MWKDRRIGAIVMVAGLALVNVVYLWDVVLGKHEGWIYLGGKAWVAIFIANIVLVGGMVMTIAARSRPQSGSSDEPAAKVNTAAESAAGEHPPSAYDQGAVRDGRGDDPA